MGMSDINKKRKVVNKMKYLKKLYNKNYKKLLIIPFLLLFLAIGQIAFQTATTGDFIHKGISLKGGTTITVFDSDSNTLDSVSLIDIQNELSNSFPSSEVVVQELKNVNIKGLIITTNIQEKVELDNILDYLATKYNIVEEDYTVEVIGSSLGNSFFRQAFIAAAVAFILMGIAVFFYFKMNFVPSIAVILSAFSDIVVTLAVFNILGFTLDKAGLAAFLMLIGYSVDTDILLTSSMLKGKGKIISRIFDAFKTGIMMTITTLTAVIIALSITNSDVVKQIMIIVLIGLLVDLVNTWIQNAGLLRWHLEKTTGEME